MGWIRGGISIAAEFYGNSIAVPVRTFDPSLSAQFILSGRLIVIHSFDPLQSDAIALRKLLVNGNRQIADNRQLDECRLLFFFSLHV